MISLITSETSSIFNDALSSSEACGYDLNEKFLKYSKIEGKSRFNTMDNKNPGDT